MNRTDTPEKVASTDELGHLPERKGFDMYAFLLDFDITRSTCGGRSGRYASEVQQRAYMVWADQRREIERLRAGYMRLRDASDNEMRDGDLERTVAIELLGPDAANSRQRWRFKEIAMAQKFQPVGWLIDNETEHARMLLGSNFQRDKMGTNNRLVVTLLDAQEAVYQEGKQCAQWVRDNYQDYPTIERLCAAMLASRLLPNGYDFRPNV